MKKLLIITSALFTLGLTSCTKVIDLDLNTSDPQYVIEGNITNVEGNQVVHITRSINYSEDNNFPPVTNAIVVITDGTDNRDTLVQETPGYYQTKRTVGVPGQTYTMHVFVDGHEFSSTSTMPLLVTIDSMNLVAESIFGEDVKTPVVTYQDLSGTRNFYYFAIYKNDIRLKTVFAENDIVNDGSVVKTSLRVSDTTYTAGDKLRVEMQSISPVMYDYYFSLQQTIGQSSATPANPVSNISGKNVLGYFSVHTLEVRSLIVE